MFGFGKKAALRREIETLELEHKAQTLRIEVQNATTAPFIPLSDGRAMEQFFGGGAGGVTAQGAMAHSVVYSCVFLIAGSIAMLPLRSYRKDANGQKANDFDSPAARLLAERPNPVQSRTVFMREFVSNMLLEGNGIAYIERKSFRDPTPVALWAVPWARTGVAFQMINGVQTLVYSLLLDDGRHIVAHQDDVIHVSGSAMWNIVCAMSPLTAYALSVGIGISQDKFAKAYFDNGFAADSVVSYPNGFKGGAEQRDEIREHVRRKFGGEQRFAGPLILDQGGKFEMLRINAADTQLLESRRFQANDIARIFRVPPHLINEFDKASTFGKGLEEMSQSFIDFTLGPHLDAIEDEFSFKLYGQRGRFAEFDREAFVRGDLKSRMEAMQIALGGAQGPGLMTQNEIRGRLGLPRVDDPKADLLLAWDAGAPAKKPPAKSSDPAKPA